MFNKPSNREIKVYGILRAYYPPNIISDKTLQKITSAACSRTMGIRDACDYAKNIADKVNAVYKLENSAFIIIIDVGSVMKTKGMISVVLESSTGRNASRLEDLKDAKLIADTPSGIDTFLRIAKDDLLSAGLKVCLPFVFSHFSDMDKTAWFNLHEDES